MKKFSLRLTVMTNAQRRIAWPLLLLIAGLCGLAANYARESSAQTAARPNIVLFVADDLGVWDTAPYGNKIVRTPHLDQLAKESLRFTRAFANSPTCVPSRAVLYTSLMPIRNGAYVNHSQCRADIRTLPHYFSDLGYRVAQAGKQHFNPKSVFPFERVQNSETPEPGFEKKPGLNTDLNTAAVDGWLSGVGKGKPFFLIVADHSPHVVWPEKSEYTPEEVDIPPTHIDTPDYRKARVRYYTDITKMDANVGRVLESLKKYGFAENTIFIFTSDQGPQWPFAKWNVYDAGLQTPLLIRWPGRVKPGITEAMVSHVDLLPTLIEAVGGKIPTGLDGLSYLRVLEGRAKSHLDYVFGLHTQDGMMNRTPQRSVRTARYKYILNLSPEIEYTTHIDKATDHDGGREYWPSWEAKAKTDQWAAEIIRRYHRRPREEFYDVVADPHETRNLIAEPKQARAVNELRARLVAWRKRQGDDKTGPEPQ
jgi:N-sulfoglucosamine sulfohydrolase